MGAGNNALLLYNPLPLLLLTVTIPDKLALTFTPLGSLPLTPSSFTLNKLTLFINDGKSV